MPTSSDLPPGTALVFVYGTLKRGGSNHRWMDGQRYLGPARTVAGHTLYSLGDYPGLVADPADRAGVEGELWAVDAAALARLDAFEGVPEGLYARVPLPLAEWPPTAALAPDADGRPPVAQTYVYLRDLAGRPRLGSRWPIG